MSNPCLVRKMIALVRRWNIARPCTQCSLQSNWTHQINFWWVGWCSSLKSLHWQNISTGHQSLWCWLHPQEGLLVWMTWLCNVQRSWGRWGFELVWLNQDSKDYLFDLELFLRQMRIFFNINRFNSFHVQLVQLKKKNVKTNSDYHLDQPELFVHL